MNRFIILLLLGLSLVTAQSLQAGVVERDWQTPGDGLLTYDDVNQREWLDLTETFLPNFPGNDIESHYQSVAAEIAPGGKFEGFTIPVINTEIVALAESAGIDTMTLDPAVTNLQATLELIALLGETTPLGGTDRGSLTIGYYDEFMAPPSDPLGRAAGALLHSPRSGRDGISGLRIGTEFTGDIFTFAAGVFLYRNAVPEPSTIVIAATFLSIHLNIYSHRKGGGAL